MRHVAGTTASQGGRYKATHHPEFDQEFSATAPDWPAIELGTHQWRSAVDTIAWPRSVQPSIRNGEFQSAVTRDIEHAPVVLPPQLSTLVTDASVQIARFDAEVGHEINHFSAVLLRTESVASSKIENLTASARAIADAELTGTGGGNATLILANTRAMTAAIDLSAQLDADAILAMTGRCWATATPRSPGGGAPTRCGSAAETSARTTPCSCRRTIIASNRPSTTW